MSTTSSFKSTRLAIVVQTASELQTACLPLARVVHNFSTALLRKYLYNACPACQGFSVFIILWAYEIHLFLTEWQLYVCARMLSLCQTPSHSQTPHQPCARGCKGRVGWPGWIVSSPWRCKDRRCCCCNCCICKSCCWKANCCVATCCCWGWKRKNAHLSIQSKALTEDLQGSLPQHPSTADYSHPLSRQASEPTTPYQRRFPPPVVTFILPKSFLPSQLTMYAASPDPHGQVLPQKCLCFSGG